jgi:Fur family peroxide stress response transcriptional regulator
MEAVVKLLTDKNIPITLQRRVILEELTKRNDHPTAEELYRSLRHKMRKLSLATIYRTLETLTGAHLITEHNQGKYSSRYEVNRGSHYHVICLKCGKMEDVFGIAIQSLEDEVAKMTGYRVEKHRLDIYGLCPDCRISSIPIQLQI